MVVPIAPLRIVSNSYGQYIGHKPPIFCAAMPVLAQIARQSAFLAYFFLRASMIALKSNDLPVPARQSASRWMRIVISHFLEKSRHQPAEPVKNMFLSSSTTIRNTLSCSALSPTLRPPVDLFSDKLLVNGSFAAVLSPGARPGTVCLGAKNASSVVRWTLTGPFVLESPTLLRAFRFATFGRDPGITRCTGALVGCLDIGSTFVGRWPR